MHAFFNGGESALPPETQEYLNSEKQKIGRQYLQQEINDLYTNLHNKFVKALGDDNDKIAILQK